MSEVLKKFGRYFLLDQIAQGGMAEIYRARLAAADGAGRLLVIKRIQAGFGSNNEFLQMFKSEIKVTMGFNHSNIVQLYDFGEEQEQPYIAMEYVDGKNLRQLLNRFREIRQAFPVEYAAHIIEQAAAGLFYAHSFRDKISGEPLNVVHRDISPQNILISFEGNVKIIDFGIAKAKTNSEQTRAGVIKGKPSYLSPEQISGDALDGRTDLFALGAVFWELLTGTKLFQGDNDLAVLKLIESCTTTVRPPSELNPNVPRELDQIVMRMLTKQPDRRFQTGEEISRTLRKFMIQYSPDFNPGDLAQVVKEMFNKEIVEDRKRIQRLNDRVEQLLQNEIVPPPAPSIVQNEKPEETTTFVSAKAQEPVAQGTGTGGREYTVENEEQKFAVEPVARATRTRVTQTPATGSYSRGTATVYGGHSPYRSKSSSNGLLSSIGLIAAGAAFVFVSPRLGIRIPVLTDLIHGPASARRNVPEMERRPAVDPETQQAPIESAPPAEPQVKARLKLEMFPEGPAKKISLNGTWIDPRNPTIEVETGIPLELLIERDGFQTLRSEFTIHEGVLGANQEYVKVVNLEPRVEDGQAREIANIEDFGYLTISSTPPSVATIYLNGKLFERKNVPVERMKVPPGDYEVRFYSPTLDMEDRQKFTVQKGRTVKRVVDLKPR